MKKAIQFISLMVLFVAMAIINGIVFVFGAKPKLIKKKLVIGSMILTIMVFGTKKPKAQEFTTCFVTVIGKNENKKASSKFISYIIVDEMPSFTGGEVAYYLFLKKT